MSGGSAAKGAKDWHSSKHIGKRARYLLEHPDEQIPSDVTFVVGDGKNEPQKTFKCHKFILAMVSSMFQAMFYGSFPQTDDIIKVPDVSPRAFQYLLRYAYGENIDWDDKCLEDALDTLFCAKKYLVDKLARSCRDHIQFHTIRSKKDSCVILQWAYQTDEEDLATLALARIALCTVDVMKGDAFPRLSFDCLKTVVDYAYLNAKELEIYQGVRRWMEHNVGAITGSALRDAFGSLLHSIRFPLFSATELANGPVKDKVLTSDEASAIFEFLFADVKPVLAFIAAPRTPMAAPFVCCFKLMTALGSGLIEGSSFNDLWLFARPDLAPGCCAFLRQLVNGQLHIRIASYDNEHSGKTMALPEAVVEERNALSFSIKSACWFEWDIKNGTARNIRIGVAWKPHLNHSAVFGLVLGMDDMFQAMPFTSWDDKRIQGVGNFRLC